MHSTGMCTSDVSHVGFRRLQAVRDLRAVARTATQATVRRIIAGATQAVPEDTFHALDRSETTLETLSRISAEVSDTWADVETDLGTLSDTLQARIRDLQAEVLGDGRKGSRLFLLVAEEEANIRANPAARTTELLRRVFGSLD